MIKQRFPGCCGEVSGSSEGLPNLQRGIVKKNSLDGIKAGSGSKRLADADRMIATEAEMGFYFRSFKL